MGTKRKLTPLISEIVGASRPGVFLDAFAGMCSVGSRIGDSRPVWSNDLQCFSNLVSTALFCSRAAPPNFRMFETAFAAEFDRNSSALRHEHEECLAREREAIFSLDHASLRSLFEEKQQRDAFRPKQPARYDLFVERYAGVYFSVDQCIEIDSFRYAADGLLAKDIITVDAWRWLLISLAIAMNRCSSTTGHFAQPLAPKPKNVTRLARERSKSILTAAISALSELMPIGSAVWREGNRVFNADAATLLTHLGDGRTPAVVYADPPYTADHYSRYYHLYDTLVLYDYPGCLGRGRYRGGRAISDFCLPTKVHGAIESLISSCAKAGSDLILSYPQSGLLDRSVEQIPELMQAHYGRLPTVHSIYHTHSTMGASKGGAATEVVEIIYKVAA